MALALPRLIPIVERETRRVRTNASSPDSDFGRLLVEAPLPHLLSTVPTMASITITIPATMKALVSVVMVPVATLPVVVGAVIRRRISWRDHGNTRKTNAYTDVRISFGGCRPSNAGNPKRSTEQMSGRGLRGARFGGAATCVILSNKWSTCGASISPLFSDSRSEL